MNDFNFKVHYLRLTYYSNKDDLLCLWRGLHLNCLLGEFVDLGYGGRFYRGSMEALEGCRLYYDPSGVEVRCTIEIPGQACERIGHEKLSELYQLAARDCKLVCSRIDLAFDGWDCCPLDLFDAIEGDRVKTYSDRKTLVIMASPGEVNENGEIGTTSVTLGSRTSKRFMRCYDRHGFTRVELECKEERANLVAADVMTHNEYENAFDCALGHLRDFIEVLEDWFQLGVAGVCPASCKMGAKELDINKIVEYVRKLSAAFSIAAQMDRLTYSEEHFLSEILALGRQKRAENVRYKRLEISYCE